MQPQDYSRQSDDYNRVEKAIRYIEDNFASQPSLAQIAESVHLSKYHFDRMFKRWAGISPIQFQQFMTLDYTKQKLIDSRSLLDTALDAGLSGPGRLHDLFVTFEAITPGEFKKQGAGLKISYLIPCHRVIAKSGKIHQYRWGSARKKAMIDWEAARRA